MKLNQALKLKNRLVGEYNRLQQVFQREHTRRSDNQSKVNRDQVWTDLITTRERLSEVKTAIAKANIGIYDKIEQMAELKNLISWINCLNTRDGEEITFVGRDQEKLTYTWNPHFKREDIDRLIAEYQDSIDHLQDEIDTYNATTSVEL